MSLAEKLKSIRIKRKLSMSQVARLSTVCNDRRSKITQGYISRLESGREDNPSYLKLKTLCRIYRIRPGALFEIKF